MYLIRKMDVDKRHRISIEKRAQEKAPEIKQEEEDPSNKSASSSRLILNLVKQKIILLTLGKR